MRRVMNRNSSTPGWSVEVMGIVKRLPFVFFVLSAGYLCYQNYQLKRAVQHLQSPEHRRALGAMPGVSGLVGRNVPPLVGTTAAGDVASLRFGADYRRTVVFAFAP